MYRHKPNDRAKGSKGNANDKRAIFRLPSELWEAVGKAARKGGISASKWIRQAMRSKLKEG